MALLSQSEFAKRQGWSRQYVAKLVKSGKIKLVNGKVDEQAALSALKQQAEPASALRQAPARQEAFPATLTDSRQAVDFVTARTMREAFKARMAKMEYEEKSGKLTDAARVRDDAFQAARMVRDALMGIPDRQADVLAAETDPKKIRELLMNELEDILNELSRQ
ncbi:hypothetical protein NX722_10080 [Endozoicomonas gorgoniicola]|uniref:Terminase small subunit n=1 Tax=Endozoicomonas gorgoniicola TaxID=1234144 RepID=A0ABT3MRP7_9GAMM|nr:hypothetical protein [Endozoicomonas gorgoniicola]MCW7551803.1 hypothetical protein [Endozoicomonas gorgoniicola]MCW7552981.1 hypothetical protein [Endozoicomonas gorgoniicola]